MVSRPLLRYHGAKWRIAPWVIEHFPEHQVYVEPFGGGASIMLRKPRAYAEIYNDTWGDVVNVFRQIRDNGEKLQALLWATPFARDEFELCYQRTDDPLERARRTIFLSHAGFGSGSANTGKRTGFRANSNRSHTTPALDWRNYPAHVAAFVDRMRGVVIENRDAWAVIQRHDGPDTLHYLDPPYLPETRSMNSSVYAAEMTEDEHRALLAAVHDLSGMVVISGYPSALYDSALDGWTRVARHALADGARDRVEVLWLNEKAVTTMRQKPLFE